VANDICVKFGRRLRELREERGWNQKYLAEISGVGRTHISQLENGRRAFGPWRLSPTPLNFGWPTY